jgi:ABC-type transport system substrate-binding protein
MDKLLRAAQQSFEPKELADNLAKVHTKMVDDVLFVWVVHDVAPRAMSKKVKGFVQARNWFQSLSSVSLDN